MRSVLTTFCLVSLLGSAAAAAAAPADCPGNPDALGTSRVLTVDPSEHRRIGTMQYPESLPLADKEVVLTFDDGPLPPYSTRILETLASECVKATFFMVGRQAQAYPAMVRHAYNEGHTIASHSQSHPLIFTRLPAAAAEREIDLGMASVSAALGDPKALAPFFRFPGLGRSQAIESYLASKNMMVWSADFPADDWTRISAQQVLARALERLEHKGKGVLLLHDIQPATALMLPTLLRELKARGYHIVQVVPSGVDRPKTVTEPEQWVTRRPLATAWPRLAQAMPRELPAPSITSFAWPHPFRFQGLTGEGFGDTPVPDFVAEDASEPSSSSLAMELDANVDATASPPTPSFIDFGVPDHPAGPDIKPPDTEAEWVPESLIVAPSEIFTSMTAPPPLPPVSRRSKPAAPSRLRVTSSRMDQVFPPPPPFSASHYAWEDEPPPRPRKPVGPDRPPAPVRGTPSGIEPKPSPTPTEP